MLTVRGQQHSFSTHERVFLRKCQSFWDRKCLDLRGTGTPNLRIHAECSNHLSYQGQTFAVPCFQTGTDLDHRWLEKWFAVTWSGTIAWVSDDRSSVDPLGQDSIELTLGERVVAFFAPGPIWNRSDATSVALVPVRSCCICVAMSATYY